VKAAVFTGGLEDPLFGIMMIVIVWTSEFFWASHAAQASTCVSDKHEPGVADTSLETIDSHVDS
jgi:hypothetical protein